MSDKKVAIITGITGQDGPLLAKFLIQKGYAVHGLVRRSSFSNTQRLAEVFGKDVELIDDLTLHFGDMTDSGSLFSLIKRTQPDEIYNLAAQSDVAVSFESPEYTANTDALGTLRILEAIKILELAEKTKFYQASSSELFGFVQESPQRETTPFWPRSPYAVAKLYAYWITVNYRESYNIFACNGILFNHESSLRGENFVSKKITKGLSRIYYNLQSELSLGNLYALRDWGHARDYIQMQWLMLQHDQPEDFVIATGSQYSVKHFVSTVAKKLGMDLNWSGEGLNEVAFWRNCPDLSKRESPVIKVDPKLFRPAEVDSLLGDSSKAREKLGFDSFVGFDELVDEMVAADIKKAQQELLISEKSPL